MTRCGGNKPLNALCYRLISYPLVFHYGTVACTRPVPIVGLRGFIGANWLCLNPSGFMMPAKTRSFIALPQCSSIAVQC